MAARRAAEQPPWKPYFFLPQHTMLRRKATTDASPHPTQADTQKPRKRLPFTREKTLGFEALNRYEAGAQNSAIARPLPC